MIFCKASKFNGHPAGKRLSNRLPSLFSQPCLLKRDSTGLKKMNYLAQIERIKNKLTQAKRKDPKLKVFGAARHQYVLSKPVSNTEVKNFEEKYNLQLPEDYKCFVTHIGNGGISYRNSGATLLWDI